MNRLFVLNWMLGLLFVTLGCGQSQTSQNEAKGSTPPPVGDATKLAREKAAAAMQALAEKAAAEQRVAKKRDPAEKPPVVEKILPTPGITRTNLNKDELRRLVEHIPGPFWQGLSDEELAKELETVAFAFDYRGGPIRLWLEFEESGQKP